MRITKPQFFYHITFSKNWPKYVKLLPRPFPGYGEPTTARICVSSTISQCISAIGICRSRKYIYRTLHKVSAYYPRNVADVRITRERWCRAEPIS